MACSSNQTSDPEVTNPDFFFMKASLYISKELKKFVYFDSQTKICFEQIKTKSQFRDKKKSGFVD